MSDNNNSHLGGRYAILAAIITGVFGIFGVMLQAKFSSNSSDSIAYSSEKGEPMEQRVHQPNEQPNANTIKLEDDGQYKLQNEIEEIDHQIILEKSNLISLLWSESFHNIENEGLNLLQGYDLIEDITKHGYPNSRVSKIYKILNVYNPLSGHKSGNYYLFDKNGKWLIQSASYHDFLRHKNKFSIVERVNGFEYYNEFFNACSCSNSDWTTDFIEADKIFNSVDTYGYPNQNLKKIYLIKNVWNAVIGKDIGNWYFCLYDGEWVAFSESGLTTFFNYKNSKIE